MTKSLRYSGASYQKNQKKIWKKMGKVGQSYSAITVISEHRNEFSDFFFREKKIKFEEDMCFFEVLYWKKTRKKF